ncbi:MAG: Tol-Pal system protein TolB, partial [Alphaproteobacteria bacterium]
MIKMPIIVQSIFSRCLAIIMVLSAGLVLTLADGAKAQLRMEITEGPVAPPPFAIAEFTGPDGNVTEVGRQLTQIISDDLESSGLFRPVDSAAFIDPPKAPSVKPNFANWLPLGVKGLLVGSAYIDDAGMLQVEFVLWDVVIQRNITAGGGNADQSGLRRLAHQIADFVYEEFTGDSG